MKEVLTEIVLKIEITIVTRNREIKTKPLRKISRVKIRKRVFLIERLSMENPAIKNREPQIKTLKTNLVLIIKMTEITAEIKGAKDEETAMQKMIRILIKDNPSVNGTVILTTRVTSKIQVNKRPGNN